MDKALTVGDVLLTLGGIAGCALVLYVVFKVLEAVGSGYNH